MTEPAAVSVLGAGRMGAGIAQVCLQAGYTVLIYDQDPDRIGLAVASIQDGLHRLSTKGKLPGRSPQECMSRLSQAATFADLTKAEIVLEAVAEDLTVKQAVFAALDAAAAPSVVLATNTSALSISSIAAATGLPERVIGLHFFNPAPIMGLVEVIPGAKTSKTTTEWVTEFATRLGKTPVRATDGPGFIVSRVLDVMINEAIRCVMAGNDPVDVDVAMTLGCNHPIGPLALADLMGLDILLSVMEQLRSGLGNAYQPAGLLVDMVAQGKLGRKSGQGFFSYKQP